MLKMAVGHSEEWEADAAAAEILADCAEQLDGQTPQAGLLLANHDIDVAQFLGAVRAAHPDLELIGCTTLAPMSSTGGYGEGSTTLTLFASDVLDFTTGLGTGVATDVRSASADAVAQAMAKTDKPVALCITTPSVEDVDPVEVAKGLGAALGSGVPVFGGGAVPDYPVATPWRGGIQFHGDRVVLDSMPVLLVSGPLTVSVGIDHGWTPVGNRAVVTRAVGDLVYEIDHEPVANFYKHYLGTNDAPAIANPLAVYEGHGDRHVLRAPVSHDDVEGAITFLGGIPEGAEVQITLASQDEILDGASASIRDAMEGFPDSMEPEGALVVSCSVRMMLLGSQASSELERIRDRLGEDVPVTGFYGLGEIAPLEIGSDVRFHNETCVTVLMGT